MCKNEILTKIKNKRKIISIYNDLIKFYKYIKYFHKNLFPFNKEEKSDMLIKLKNNILNIKNITNKNRKEIIEYIFNLLNKSN